MKRGLAAAALLLAACNGGAPPSFDVAGLKPSDEPQELTGWYMASQAYRSFRLYPTASGHSAMGKGQCVSGVASSLAGIPSETLSGRKVTIMGNLYAAGAPEIGDTKDECGADVILLANDISYAE